MWCMLVFAVLISSASTEVTFTELKESVYEMAGVFDKKALTQRLAFKECSRDIHTHQGRLDPIDLQLDKADSYSAWKALCSNETMRPIAVFGPQHPVTDELVKTQCFIANIPFIQATWQPMSPKELIDTEFDVEEYEQIEYKNISINFFPDADEIAIAYAKVLKYYDWKSFAALYEDDFGLMRVQKILAEHTTEYPVVMLKLDPQGSNQQIFKKLSKYQDMSRILIDCHVDNIQRHMNDAKQMKMADMYKHFIIISLDTGILTEELEQYQANTTWLSLTNYDQIKSEQHYLARRVVKWKDVTITSSTPFVTHFQTEALIMNDVTKHVMKAVEEVEQLYPPRDSVCSKESKWSQGALLQNKILTTKTLGVTGNIEFDKYGRRVNYTLFVNEVHLEERRTIGSWLSAENERIIPDKLVSEKLGLQLNNQHFIVISKRQRPYFYDVCQANDFKCKEKYGENAYEGFSVDLVKAIFEYLNEEKSNFTYEFKLMEDHAVGAYDNKTKKWTGLIGHLLDKEADLAVCDITITKEREKVVDFSVAFMDLGISILYLKEEKKAPGMFSFMYPYTFEVWLYTATAYCVVSIIMFLCSRMSPEDWENPQPCDKDPEELENIWNFQNCTWLTMGSIMTQGCDILPKAIGSRWVCGMWWFFAVIVCQTYIAQLSASMTDALETTPINNVEDLASQNKILYGAIDPGSTLEFFMTSKDKMYRKMYENMKANPAVLVKSNDEGEKRVLKGQSRYAFFMESTSIAYKLKRNCKLKQVGDELDAKSYGIAMPANSPVRSSINRAILKLKERNVVPAIKNMWWEKKDGALDCPEETDDSGVEGDLELANLMGAFIVLIVGLVLCLFIAAAEFLFEVHDIVVREGVSFKEVLIKELKSSLNVMQLQKPVIRNPSRAPSVASSDETDKIISRKDLRAAALANFMDFEKAPM